MAGRSESSRGNGVAGTGEQEGSVVPFRREAPPSARDLPTLEDDELMLLARGGVRAAFDALVRRHQPAVLGFASKQLGHPEAARDATQNTFLGLFRYLPKYRPQDKFRAFLFRIALNECRMAKRSASRAAGAMTRLKAEPRTTPELPTEQVLTSERLREVGVALRVLKRKQRDVVLLRFAAGLTYQEIAQTLGIPVGTVKSRLFNGLARLHAELKGDRS